MFSFIKWTIQFWLISKSGDADGLRRFLVNLPERECYFYADAIAREMPHADAKAFYRVLDGERRLADAERTLGR